MVSAWRPAQQRRVARPCEARTCISPIARRAASSSFAYESADSARRRVRPALGEIWLVAVVAVCSACTYGTPRSFGPNQLSRPTSSNALAASRRGSVIGTSAPAKLPVWRLAAGAYAQDQVPEVAPEAWPASQRAGGLGGVSSAVALPARLLYLPLRRCAELAAPIRVSTTARISSVTREASDQPRERPARVSGLGPRTPEQPASVRDSPQNTRAPDRRGPRLDQREPRSARRGAGRRYVGRVPAASCHRPGQA